MKIRNRLLLFAFALLSFIGLSAGHGVTAWAVQVTSLNVSVTGAREGGKPDDLTINLNNSNLEVEEYDLAYMNSGGTWNTLESTDELEAGVDYWIRIEFKPKNSSVDMSNLQESNVKLNGETVYYFDQYTSHAGCYRIWTRFVKFEAAYYTISVTDGTAYVDGTAVTSAKPGDQVTIKLDETKIPSRKVFSTWRCNVNVGNLNLPTFTFPMEDENLTFVAEYGSVINALTVENVETPVKNSAPQNIGYIKLYFTASTDGSKFLEKSGTEWVDMTSATFEEGKSYGLYMVVSPTGATFSDTIADNIVVNGKTSGISNITATTNQVKFIYTLPPVSGSSTTTYAVDVSTDGRGTASASPSYGAAGTKVTLTATPNEGYRFKKWTVLSGGVKVTGNSFTMGTSNVEIKAEFELIPEETIEEDPVEKPAEGEVVVGKDDTKEKAADKTVEGVGTLSADGTKLKDKDGTEYLVAGKLTKDKIVKNVKIADGATGGKYKVSGVKVKRGKVTGGTVVFLKPYNSGEKKIVIKDTVTIGGVKLKVTEIAAGACKNNKNVTSLTIGKNVTKIGKDAFNGGAMLKNIKITTTKLTTKNVGKNAFKNLNKKAKAKVPAKKLKAYKSLLKARGMKGKKQKIQK